MKLLRWLILAGAGGTIVLFFVFTYKKRSQRHIYHKMEYIDKKDSR